MEENKQEERLNKIFDFFSVKLKDTKTFIDAVIFEADKLKTTGEQINFITFLIKLICSPVVFNLSASKITASIKVLVSFNLTEKKSNILFNRSSCLFSSIFCF